jgi:hypothetical protein
MQDLKEIQIEIKKELGGASLNHLLSYLDCVEKKSAYKFLSILIVRNLKNLYIKLEYRGREEPVFCKYYALINSENQALNIFGQSEEFQRKLYKAIQIINNN